MDSISDRYSFERDRKRDVIMLEAGIVTVRITAERMKQEPEQEAVGCWRSWRPPEAA